MSNLALARHTTPVQTYSDSTLALIRRTVAADCNNDEFDMFINMARALQLDPLRRQIYAFVFSKDKPDKRRMSIITAIDGFRTIADRTGNYRPDEDEPEYEIDPAQISEVNPIGLVKATVRCWKFSHGNWHRVTASAYWSEYAPLKDEWAYDEQRGKNIKTGKQTLDTSGNWGRMPRLMLAKVAEALALRKAWPDDLSSVYAKEELDRANIIDVTPSEAAEQGAMKAREALLGGPSVLVDWLDGSPLAPVQIGQFADRALEFIKGHRDEPSQILMWAERNRHSFREFWKHSPGDANEIKQAIAKATTAEAA